ncbi:uncharacterized protein LOC127707745 [Mytilus californianus]|uniref:uncharacterized protein LOC127707745 n=1 Tax=Mytilus californianus TaxID=6549 RepID=UPI002247242A|nr:uncharacterized protein LOC127707745 [Mytilus californianus]
MSCNACYTTNSWRFHSLKSELFSFFDKFTTHFVSIYIPTSKKTTLCNSCYCMIKKLKEWSENIYRTERIVTFRDHNHDNVLEEQHLDTETEISLDPQTTDCLRNGHFGSIE